MDHPKGRHHPHKLIAVRNLSFAIDRAPIIEDLSLEVRSGELIGLIGPNGAGKTTLLKLLGGLVRPVSGTIDLMDRPLASYTSRAVARLIAHVPQSTAIEFAFTAREVVLMGRSPHLRRFEMEGDGDSRMADEAMRRVDVSHLADRLITTLSGGERQRVFIARALAQQPHLLLLDEPTANLDVRHQIEVLEIVGNLARNEGLAVVAAIHDLNLAAAYSDRLVLLNRGQILADDVPSNVLTPAHLAAAFHVSARVYHDPFSDALRLSLSRNGQQDCAQVEGDYPSAVR